jgi:hypothetical protein
MTLGSIKFHRRSMQWPAAKDYDLESPSYVTLAGEALTRSMDEIAEYPLGKGA